MKVASDPTVRSVYITLQPAHVVDSESLAPGVVVDYDADDRIIGLELVDVPTPDAGVTASPPDPRAVCNYVRALLGRRVTDPDSTRTIIAALEQAAAV